MPLLTRGSPMLRMASLVLCIGTAICVCGARVAQPQPRMSDCTGVRVSIMCCGNDGQYHLVTKCIYLSAWTAYWNECAGPIPQPNCPYGEHPWNFVHGAQGSCGNGHGWHCDGSEGSWVQPVNPRSPLTPNCSWECSERCWEGCPGLWQCAPWGVKCQDWI